MRTSRQNVRTWVTESKGVEVFNLYAGAFWASYLKPGMTGVMLGGLQVAMLCHLL